MRIRCPIKNFIRRSWYNLQRRVINGTRPEWNNPGIVRDYLGKNITLKVSRKEFAEWCWEREAIIRNILAQKISPSIDRLDSNDHYTLANMQIISFNENRKKACMKRSERIARAIKTLPSRFCPICQKQLIQHHYPDGKIKEATPKFILRKTCGIKCSVDYKYKKEFTP